jgi:hypothetical protein
MRFVDGSNHWPNLEGGDFFAQHLSHEGFTIPPGKQWHETPAILPAGGMSLHHKLTLHGKLAVSVADTGLGFGKAATAGTGVGLANIRERLQLLYGSKATLTVAENPPGGTIVTLTVPYRPIEGAHA